LLVNTVVPVHLERLDAETNASGLILN
jgi:hypothetical protein